MADMRTPLFHRTKSSPFTGKIAVKIDYKDVRTLSRYVSERGKMMPSRISGNSVKVQRELAKAIKRARHLALMAFVSNAED